MPAKGRRWWRAGRASTGYDANDHGEAVRTPLPAGTTHVVAIVSPNGNTGKTTTTAALGAILASERDDPIIAVDANDGMLGRYAPANGTGASLRALAARLPENGLDIGQFTSRSPSGLDILADGAAATAPSEPLDAVSYSALLTALTSYGVVLSDCATGVEGLAAFVALTGADQQIFVSSRSESSIAATVDALAAYRYLADRSHVVLTGVRDSATMLDARDAAARLGGSCRSVVIVPFDEQLADGSGRALEGMRDATWEAYRELAAVVAAGFPRTKGRGAGQPVEDDDRGDGRRPVPGGPQQGNVTRSAGDGFDPSGRTAAELGSDHDDIFPQPSHEEQQYHAPNDAVPPTGSFSSTGGYPDPSAPEAASPQAANPDHHSRTSFDRPGPGSPPTTYEVTDAGLPRRSPTTASDTQNATWGVPSAASEGAADSGRRPTRDERRQPPASPSPHAYAAQEQVRGRLTNLRRGIQQGRRAGTDANDPSGPQGEPDGADPPAGSAESRSRRPLGHGGWSGNSTSSSRGGEASVGPAMTPPPARPQPGAGMPSAASAHGGDELSAPHHLIAELAEQAAPNREVPLHVRIAREPGHGEGSVRMRSFPLPEEGARLTITVTAQGLRALGDLQQELTVYPGRDSDVLYFGLRTVDSGLHQVTVRAFHKGTYLGAVRCQISVTEGGVTRDGPRRHALLPGIAFEPGEATLQVHRNAEDGSFSFQLLSETCYPPEQFRFRGGDPRQAAEQIYAQLREAARRAGRGTPADVAGLRSRLRNQGVQLWSAAVPEAVQRQFWEQADRITSFTVLGEHDFVPWELLYPLDAHHDNGFLAEWLPVVRRVFRQDRVHHIALPGAAFVMPPGSPQEAGQEIAELRTSLGPGVADAGLLTKCAELTTLIERGHAGLLHFACHNAFSGSGSRVTMADGHFEPIDLATAAQTHSLRAHHPLVFFNACRSAGEIDWFSSALGWAPQFLRAGAGAFIGTLWPVRSDSARQFAKAFYSRFLDAGQPLGRASLTARQAIRDRDGDPSWLAYAVYGSPAATATMRGPS
ncbi:CHAT domain-containing protein [Streptomyces griseochromogenes]|uniref:CHAT domain-containing protein n=1 Tax=Streptomyces griseochromogenes TaxID=68214 RepID=UPI0037A73338